MIKVKEAIVVEGRYDKNTLSQIFDAVIIETSGFGIFSDSEKLELLRRLAKKRGLIILTDPDGAGFVIRNYLRGSLDPKLVKHAYIPDIPGKEKRKTSPSKEGTLGVEGMAAGVLVEALRRCGATFEEETKQPDCTQRITKADLYTRGLSGGENSAKRRRAFLKELGLPEKLGGNALLEVLNALMERSEFLEMDIML